VHVTSPFQLLKIFHEMLCAVWVTEGYLTGRQKEKDFTVVETNIGTFWAMTNQPHTYFNFLHRKKRKK